MPAATASVNGYMTSTYASKLDGIAAGATAAPAGVFGQAFTSSGTFTIPTGVTALKVTLVSGGGGSGGGGGYGSGFPAGGAGGNGGTSSFGGYMSATGGGGGGGGGPYSNPYYGGDGANGTNGGGTTSNVFQSQYSPAYGKGLNGTSVGGGNGGGSSGSGGAGYIEIGYVTGLTPGGTVTVTVGSAGSAGLAANGYTPGNGIAGSAGFVLVEW
jgi:hypothetical protein